jgi:hypothetical protein
MRAILAALFIALLTMPGAAQFSSMGDKKKEESKAPKKSSDDKDYKAAIERLPDQKFDPWRNMR